jgi:hypothetical protein
MHVMHEGRGDSWTLYLGSETGARYVGLDARGFNGWTSRPRWLTGGWEFYEPTLHWGRLGMDVGRYRHLGRILVPAKLVHAKRMLRPSYRRAMRDEPQQR